MLTKKINDPTMNRYFYAVRSALLVFVCTIIIFVILMLLLIILLSVTGMSSDGSTGFAQGIALFVLVIPIGIVSLFLSVSVGLKSYQNKMKKLGINIEQEK